MMYKHIPGPVPKHPPWSTPPPPPEIPHPLPNTPRACDGTATATAAFSTGKLASRCRDDRANARSSLARPSTGTIRSGVRATGCSRADARWADATLKVQVLNPAKASNT